jgi:hypothetical protein
MAIFDIIHRGRDYLLEQAVKKWFNLTQHRYGTMTHIEIDSEKKHINIELQLKGELAALKIEISDYNLISVDGDTYLEVGSISTSREWISVLLTHYLTGDRHRFRVPELVKILL